MANRTNDDGISVPPSESVFDPWYEPDDVAGNVTDPPDAFPGEWSMGALLEAEPPTGTVDPDEELNDILTGYIDLRSDDVLPVARESGRRASRADSKNSVAPESERTSRRDREPQPAPRSREPDRRDAHTGGSDGGRRSRVTATPSGAGRIILPIALALVAVVALYAGWTKLRSSFAADPFATVSVSSKPFAPSTVSSSPRASATPAPTPTSSAVSTAAATPAVSESSSGAPTSTSVEPNRSTPVEVFNATTRKGLAAKVAETLRAAGWDVVVVGNWTGGAVRATTVYATGNAASVATMTSDLPTADKVGVTPSKFAAAHLIVVVGADYPSTA